MAPEHWILRGCAALALALVLAAPLRGQEHGHPAAAAPADSAAPSDSTAPADSVAAPEGHAMAMAMRPGSLGIPPEREGSGTSWLPDESPMYAVHRQAGVWELMLHGSVFVHYLNDGGDRGEEQFGSTNWVMAMARRPVGGGSFLLRGMASLDPLTVGECGYPNLVASGEACDGEPIHDRQHPHDLLMELAAAYERELSPAVALQLYGGPVGEPALGPVAFPHRVSALPNPLAPIAHHWLDSTHITFGVLTAGLFGRRWKAEASIFNGREPDEERFDINLDALDSYAGRLWFLPTDRWALQVSSGRLNEAESHATGEPPVDVTRTTASATYHRPLGGQGIWASTFAWGRNVEDDRSTHAFLLETNVNLDERNLVYGRIEAIEKTGEDLVLPEELDDRTFDVGKVGVGYVRQLDPIGGWVPGFGAGVTLALLPEDLEPFYGSTTPAGLQLFFRVRPAPMAMEGGH